MFKYKNEWKCVITAQLNYNFNTINKFWNQYYINIWHFSMFADLKMLLWRAKLLAQYTVKLLLFDLRWNPSIIYNLTFLFGDYVASLGHIFREKHFLMGSGVSLWGAAMAEHNEWETAFFCLIPIKLVTWQAMEGTTVQLGAIGISCNKAKKIWVQIWP